MMPASGGVTASARGVREVDLLVRARDSTRRIAKFAFSKSDASVYIAVIGRQKRFRLGIGHFAPGVATIQVVLNEPPHGDAVGLPFVSLHQSGRVHVKGGGYQSRPLAVPPIAGFRGVHAATILVENFSDLALFEGKLSASGPNRTLVLDGVPDDWVGLRIPVYVNGREASFGDPCQLVFTLQRPGLAHPLYVGINVRANNVRDAQGGPAGVVMAVGWDPTKPELSAATDILLVRAV